MRVGGLLMDLEGTLYTNGGPVQSARETLKRLEYAGIPYRCITNITHGPRREISAYLREMGFPVGEDRIFTPEVAAAERLYAAAPPLERGTGRWKGALRADVTSLHKYSRLEAPMPLLLCGLRHGPEF